MTRTHLKAILLKLIDRGLSPVIQKLDEDEYTISVSIPSGTAKSVTPTDLQDVLDLGVGVQVESVKFT
jgi:hypothetical protein